MLKTNLLKLLTLTSVLLTSSPVLANTATYYHNSLHGRRMANGQIFSQHSNTIASNRYKLGTRLKVCHGKRCVTGVVRDRCGNCSIDLSKGLFKQLAPLKRGRIPVRVYKY